MARHERLGGLEPQGHGIDHDQGDDEALDGIRFDPGTDAFTAPHGKTPPGPGPMPATGSEKTFS